MMEAKKFAMDVWSSAKFKLALKLYRAFASGNYVSFLKIFRNEADYLTSCILHKYLNSCRVAIINSLSVACGSSKNLYTAEQIRKILQFAQIQQTLDYMEKVGFEVDRNLETVELKKLSSSDSIEDLIEQVSSLKDNYLVDSKKVASFGEIVNNGATDQNYKTYTPKSSFAESNPEPSMPQEDERRPQDIDNVDAVDHGLPIKSIETPDPGLILDQLVDAFIHEEVELQCQNIGIEVVSEIQTLNVIIDGIYGNLEIDTIKNEVRSIAAEVVNDRRLKLSNCFEVVYEMFLDEIITEDAHSYIINERHRVAEERTLMTICTEITDSVVEEVVTAMSATTAKEIIISEFQRKVGSRLKTQMFVSWRKSAQNLRRRRSLRENFPAVLGCEKSTKYSFDFNLQYRLGCGFEIGQTQSRLNKMAVHHLAQTYDVNDILSGVFSNFVHIAILNVSPNEDMFNVFTSKLRGFVSFSVDPENDKGFNVIRFEQSCHKSYLCITVIDSSSFENHLKRFQPNILVIFDPLSLLEFQWVENIATENINLFSSFYVSACNKKSVEDEIMEVVNESLTKFQLNLSHFSSMLKFHRFFHENLRISISKRMKQQRLPKKCNFVSLISSEFKNWFCLLLDNSLQSGVNNIYKHLSLEWLLELFASFLAQINQFVVFNRVKFPLPIFANVVFEATDFDIETVFEHLTKLAIFGLCSKVGDCNSWMEYLDLLEQVISSLPVKVFLKHHLAAVCQHTLNSAISDVNLPVPSHLNKSKESDVNTTFFLENAEDFPWVQLTLQIFTFMLDNITCENANVFLLPCDEAQFVFQRPRCWSLFLQSLYSVKTVSSYFVNDTLVLTC